MVVLIILLPDSFTQQIFIQCLLSAKHCSRNNWHHDNFRELSGAVGQFSLLLRADGTTGRICGPSEFLKGAAPRA